MCDTFHPSVLHKWPSVTTSLWNVFPVAGIVTFHPEADSVGQGYPDCAEAEVGAVSQSQGRCGWLLLTLHYTSQSLHTFLFHICTEVFHISGWKFRETIQKLIQLALQMDLEENTWGLARLKLFCQHLLWAFSGLQSGISALARKKGTILCWPSANLPPCRSALTLWRTTFILAPAQWPQSHRSKAVLGPRAVAAEPDFPYTFSSGISKAAKELEM